MDNASIIAELKAEAMADPFRLHADGRPIDIPKKFHVRPLVIDGFPLTVGFTFDLVPASGFECQHLSMRGISQEDVPPAIQEQVLQLAFGDHWREAKSHRTPGRAQQWLLISRNPPDQKGFSA